jgi:hypothetical protein
MKNVALVCCHSKPWNEVASLIRQNGGEVKYWITWKTDVSDIYASGSTYVQTVEDAWLGNGYPESITAKAIDESIIRSIAYEELIAIKMLDRLDVDRYSFNFTERQRLFRKHLGYWLSILESNDIDLVVTPTAPHRVFDYALYVACKLKAVDFLFFQVTHFDRLGFIINNVEFYPEFLVENLNSTEDSGEVHPEIANKINSLIERSNVEVSYMLESKKQQDKNLPEMLCFYLEKLKRLPKLFSYVDIYQKIRGVHISESRISTLGRFITKEKQYKRIRNLKKFYNNHCVKDIPDKYVFVALHYQPEETTCPNGGVFVDQGLMIDMLIEAFPSDVSIVIKEHPFQFYRHKEGEASRDEQMYQEWLSNERVKFVQTDADQYSLSKNAIFTATVTGTIGWEAGVSGHKVLLFGRSWYVGMPNVFSIHDVKDIQRVIEGDNLISSRSDLEQYHRNLSNHLIEAPFYKSWGIESNERSEVSAEKIFNGIVTFLKKNKN